MDSCLGSSASQKEYQEFLQGHATVEDYFKNIDQRVNMKVSQAIKRAMSLIINKIDLLIDKKIEAGMKLEAAKNIALE